MLLPRAFWREALTLHDEVGLRGVLRAHPDRVVEVPMTTPDVLSDMDTQEDYARALERVSVSGPLDSQSGIPSQKTIRKSP